MLAYAAGVFVLIWRDQRRVAWQIIVAPVIALGCGRSTSGYDWPRS